MEERASFVCLIFIAPKPTHPYLELETLVLNINKGYNAEFDGKMPGAS